MRSAVIRELAEQDVPLAAAVVHECSGTDASITTTIYMRQLSHRVGQLLGAWRGSTLVGVARTAYFSPPEKNPANVAPRGWYLLGVNVLPTERRRGTARRLTDLRLAWLRRRTTQVFYFTRASNSASRCLHAPYGFAEVTRDFTFPTARLEGPTILFRLALSKNASPSA